MVTAEKWASWHKPFLDVQLRACQKHRQYPKHWPGWKHDLMEAANVLGLVQVKVKTGQVNTWLNHRVESFQSETHYRLHPEWSRDVTFDEWFGSEEPYGSDTW